MKNLFLVRHGEYDSHTGGPTGEGLHNIGKLAGLIKACTSGSYDFFSSREMRAKESAEYIARQLNSSSPIMVLERFENSLGIRDLALAYSAINSAKSDSVVVVGHLPSVRDISQFLFLSQGFVPPSELEAFHGGLKLGGKDIQIAEASGFHFCYDPRSWRHISKDTILEKAPGNSPSPPEPKPAPNVEKRKIDFGPALDRMKRDYRKPFVYIAHDSNDAEEKGTKLPIPSHGVIAMVPGAIPDFFERIKNSDKRIPLEGMFYTGDFSSVISGEIGLKNIKFNVSWKRKDRRNVSRNYGGSGKFENGLLTFSGGWADKEDIPRRGFGRFSAANNLEALGVEIVG